MIAPSVIGRSRPGTGCRRNTPDMSDYGRKFVIRQWPNAKNFAQLQQRNEPKSASSTARFQAIILNAIVHLENFPTVEALGQVTISH
jgi:hypothetical protein